MVPQSDMDFGHYLREARERRGVTLRQIATATRISPRTLEALENNDIRKLPGGIFSRSFVRSYAQEVGLDPDETVRRFLQQFPVDDVTAGSPLVEHVEPAVGEEDERQRQVKGLLIALAIGIPLIAVIAYYALSSRHTSSGANVAGTTVSQPAPDGTSPGGAAPRGDATAAGGSAGSGSAAGGSASGGAAPGAGAASPSGVPRSPETGTAGSAAAGAAGQPPTTPGAGATTGGGGADAAAGSTGDGLRIALSTAGPCWVRVSADGTVRYQGLLQPGERQAIEARNDIYLEVGDAGTLTYTLNGRAGKPLGGAGQVARARIHRDSLSTWLASP